MGTSEDSRKVALMAWQPDTLLRANPIYDLISFDELSRTDREAVGTQRGSQSIYGILRPKNGGKAPILVVSPDTALLFLTLREPAPLPRYAQSFDMERSRELVARLVLDQVLEIADGVGGNYTSGPEAVQPGTIQSNKSDRIRSLSIDALRYGQRLTNLSSGALGRRLYFFGRKPVSSALRRRYASADALESFVLSKFDHQDYQLLNTEWAESPNAELPWRIWQRRTSADDSWPAVYKLYVSPALDSVPSVIHSIVTSLSYSRGLIAFKIGRAIHDLCRPDKIVVYFRDYEGLQHAVTKLHPKLSECLPHGVPFSAPIGYDGLLSWGIDPSSESGHPDPRSWRQWVTGRLAEHLVAAQGAFGLAVEPWEFAMTRMELDGIDSVNWLPRRRSWTSVDAGLVPV